MSGRPSEAPPANPLPQTNVDELIAQYDEELPQRTLTRRLDLGVGIVCFVVSLFVLKQVFFPLAQGNQYYLMWFLAFVLPLVFICYRPGFGRKTDVADQAAEVAEAVDSTGTVDSATTAGNPKTAGQTKAKRRSNDNPSIIDWVLVALTFLTCAYPVLPFFSGGFNEFLNRQGSLTSLDVMMGGVLLLLVLEATRRTTGLILPIFCLVFFLYSYYGAYIPVSWPGSHAGQNFDQIVNALYNDASGFYGIPLDVAATYIVLFTIYGAVLDKTGAASFFIDLSFSLFKKSKAAPGRTVALSGFLLGTVSGSGTATAVSLGAVTWPVLKKAGYPKENAGGMLAASGIGAILSPPTLGAAAFIIAELLNVSYGLVLLWAVVPDPPVLPGHLPRHRDRLPQDRGRLHVRLQVCAPGPSSRRGFYHFISLGIIVVFLAIGMAPFKAVVYATLVGIGFGIIEIILSRLGEPKTILAKRSGTSSTVRCRRASVRSCRSPAYVRPRASSSQRSRRPALVKSSPTSSSKVRRHSRPTRPRSSSSPASSLPLP